MNSTAPSISKPLPLRLGLTAVFVLLCAGMHAVATRHNLVTVLGTPSLLYNLGTIPFLALTGASFFSAGGLILPAGAARTRLDAFLLRSIAGLCLFSFLGYALGMAGLLLPWVCIPVLALPLLWLPIERTPWGELPRGDKMRLVLFAVIALYLLTVSDILFQYVENDFSHYYYYYSNVLLQGDLNFPSSLYAYFYMKGAGAAHIMMAATSEFSVQLLTLYALLLMGLIAYRLCAMATGNATVALAGALLPLASKAVKMESFKGHMLISLLLFAVPYLIARMPTTAAWARGRVRLILGLTLCATVLMTPPAAIFLVAPLLFWAFLAWRGKGYGGLRGCILVIGASVATFCAVLASNYLLNGIAEFTPLNVFAKFLDLDRTRRWISDTALLFTIAENVCDSQFVLPKAFFVVLGEYALFGGLYFLARGRLLRAAPLRTRRMERVFGPLFALGSVCPVLYSVMLQSSIRRFLIFYAVVQGCYAVLALAFAVGLLAPRLRRRLPSLWPARRILTVLCGAVCCYALIFNWMPPREQQKAYAEYFLGRTSMAPVLGHWYAPEVAAIDALVPDGQVVLPLYFSPYATFYKPQKYMRMILNTYTEGLDVKLGRDAEKARAVYLAQGLRHFVATTTTNPDPMLSLVEEGYSALFSPENVARYFRVRHVTGDIWLLVLDGTDADGARPDAAFLAAYARRRAFDLHNPENIFLPRLKMATRLLPNLELPETDAPK